MELNCLTRDLEIVPSEGFQDVCQCCLSCSDLQKMVDESKPENYCDMLEYSFSIQVNTLSKSLWICMECVLRLRLASDFRKQVEKTQSAIWKCTNVQTKEIDYTSDKDVQFDDSDCHYSNCKVEHNGADIVIENSNVSEKLKHFKDESKILMKTENTEKSIRNRKKHESKAKTNKKNIRLKPIRLKSKSRRETALWENLNTEFKNSTSRKDLLPFKIEKQLSNRKCDLCGQTFVCCKDLHNHMHEHYPDHVCHICGKFYATQTTLNSHVGRVHEPPKFKCQECGKNYRNRNSIRSHILTVHRGEKLVTSYKCSNCIESFPTYYRRIVHMVEKHGLEPYKCQECGKSFINCGTLRTHVRKDHRMERKFQCELCSKSFFSNRDLVKHMICHNGEKIFQCEICLKSYARKKTLIEHVKSHNPVKAHICSVCGRGFTQKCTMNVHMKTHDKEQSTMLR